MPSGSFKQVDVKCPYYRYDNGKDWICCEGIIPDTRVRSYFSSTQELMTQLKCFCAKSYWCCEVCTALDEKYREEQNDDDNS